MFKQLSHTQDNLFAYEVSQKIEKSDIESIVEELAPAIIKYGQLRLYFEMHDFHGWTISAFWSDIKLESHYHDTFSHIAIVGENGWQEWMTKFMSPFTSAEVAFFNKDKKAQAYCWLLSQAITEKPQGQSDAMPKGVTT